MLAQINFEIISKRSWQFGEVIESSVIARFAFNGLFAKVREVGNNNLVNEVVLRACYKSSQFFALTASILVSILAFSPH